MKKLKIYCYVYIRAVCYWNQETFTVYGKRVSCYRECKFTNRIFGKDSAFYQSERKNDIITEIVECFKTNEKEEHLLDNLVVELPFASELIHLTDLQQILTQIEGRDMHICK